MQSIYWVLTWACHRKCVHCYDDRFRPYVREEFDKVAEEGQAAFQKIINNLPDDLSWTNQKTGKKERTLLVMAGGELLIDGIREELFYPTLRAIQKKYGSASPKISIQTTGDQLTEKIMDECLEHGVDSFAIASIDDYHVGMKGEKKFQFMEKIRTLMASKRVTEISLGGEKDDRLKAPDLETKSSQNGATFLFFGAQPDLWIGELWPRGRAFTNGLSDASYDTNFCARWSGGKNFLHHGQEGSEISIEPNGNIYPCCLKTKAPLGNLTEEALTDILDSVAELPAIQAINNGKPEDMALSHGWDQETFRLQSGKPDGKGRIVENRCLGCDSFFDTHLTAELETLRQQRLAVQ